MNLNGITTFLFDFDGVIADTESGRYEAYCTILAEEGYDMRSRCSMEQLVGMTGTGFLQIFFPEIPSDKAQELVDRRQAEYIAHLDRYCKPFEGVRNTLADLKARGYYLALTTANFFVTANQLLKQVGVAEFFDAVCGREICVHPVTQAKDYSLVPAHLNRTLAECIVVEDSPVGVAGAKRAGFRCIAFEHYPDKVIEEQADAIVHDYTEFRELVGLEETPCSINERFNEELRRQIAGTLPRNHTYRLGNAGAILKAAGLPDLPIEMRASRLSDKSMQENHPFDLSEVMNLPQVIQQPIAVFRSATHLGSFVIMTDLQNNKENFIVIIQANKNKHNIEINDIRSVYPKKNILIANWIDEGLLEYADKKKITDWFTKQRSYSAEVGNATGRAEWFSKQRSYSAEIRNLFNRAAKVIQNFANPQIEDDFLTKK